jgi:hypothetical protein
MIKKRVAKIFFPGAKRWPSSENIIETAIFTHFPDQRTG